MKCVSEAAFIVIYTVRVTIIIQLFLNGINTYLVYSACGLITTYIPCSFDCLGT